LTFSRKLKEIEYGFLYDVLLSCAGDLFHRGFYLDSVYAGKLFQTDIMRDYADTPDFADVPDSVRRVIWNQE
jgi:hypothetical protein